MSTPAGLSIDQDGGIQVVVAGKMCKLLDNGGKGSMRVIHCPPTDGRERQARVGLGITPPPISKRGSPNPTITMLRERYPVLNYAMQEELAYQRNGSFMINLLHPVTQKSCASLQNGELYILGVRAINKSDFWAAIHTTLTAWNRTYVAENGMLESVTPLLHRPLSLFQRGRDSCPMIVTKIPKYDQMCTSCGKSDGEMSLQKCATCSGAYFCSTDCRLDPIHMCMGLPAGCYVSSSEAHRPGLILCHADACAKTATIVCEDDKCQFAFCSLECRDVARAGAHGICCKVLQEHIPVDCLMIRYVQRRDRASNSAKAKRRRSKKNKQDRKKALQGIDDDDTPLQHEERECFFCLEVLDEHIVQPCDLHDSFVHRICWEAYTGGDGRDVTCPLCRRVL
jgi:hypothetical protein